MAIEDKFILVSLDDEKSKAVAEVLSNPTCKKIINHLAENKEESEKDLSEKLNIPLNTVEYNLNKLVSSGFVQKRKNFFWSKKGKKIVMYELSNKSILISHKKSTGQKIKSITPAIIITLAGTFAIWAYQQIAAARSAACNTGLATGVQACTSNFSNVGTTAPSVAVAHTASQAANVISSQPIWQWFLIGGLLAIIIISIINWRKL